MAMLGGAIRKLVQPYVREMTRQGLSGVKMLEILRRQGLGYRMTNFYADVRKYRAALASREPILATALRHRFDRRLFQPSRTIVRKFEYVVRVETKNKKTGKLRYRESIVATNKQLTRQKVEEAGRFYLSEMSPKTDEEVIGAEIDSLYYNPEKVWRT